MLSFLRRHLSAFISTFSPVARLRTQIEDLQKKNAELRHDLKRLHVHDRAPGRLLLPLLPERVQALHGLVAPGAVDRERAFARTSPTYRKLRDRLRHHDPPAAHAADIGGLAIWVPDDACTDGSLSSRILHHRWLPLDDIARVRRFVVGGTMLDIGANVGTTAIPRLALGDFTTVYGAEPNAANYECLVANVIRNGLEGRLMPDRVAISSWDGGGRLHDASQIGGHHLLLAGRGAKGSVEDVTCLTLDSWVRRLGLPPREISFVKVDVQGWDAHVLMGAPMLRAHRHIAWQIELAPRQMKRAGIDVRLFCALAEATFTHLHEIGAGAELAQPIIELPALLERTERQGRYTNALFCNQPLAPVDADAEPARRTA